MIFHDAPPGRRDHRRQERPQSGTSLRITQLTRGVYIGREDGDALLLQHAVRIAHYLYPQAYLSSASALTLGPTLDGRLFRSGRRNQRTRLRSLEIVQNAAPAHPSTIRALVADELGELRIEVSSPRQRFLEAFDYAANLAVLRIAQPDSSTFSSVRFAPLYDAVSTRVFPRLAGDRMALKLNGRDDRLGVDDFVAAGKTMSITSTAARTACRQLADRLSATTLKLPASAQAAAPMLDALLKIIDTRSAALR